MFKAEEWENFGLATVDSSLIYSIIDVLLGGRRGQTSLRIEGRPYTTIETNLVKRLVEVVLADAEQAFRPLSPVTFSIDRLETNPRFAAISQARQRRDPGAAAHRHGRPRRQHRTAAALRHHRADPRRCCCRCSWARSSAAIRSGKAISRPRVGAGRDRGRRRAVRGRHSAQAADEAEGRRHPAAGNASPTRWCTVRCGNVLLTEGRMGRVGDRVAIRVTKQLRKPNTTFAMFEKADEQTKLMEAQ